MAKAPKLQDRGAQAAQPPKANAAFWLRLLTAAVCVVYGLSAVYNLYGFARILAFPVDVNAGEGVVVYEAQRLAARLPIYKPLDAPPYWFSTYPPLYQLMVSLWVQNGLVWGRILSLGSSLWSCLALGLMVWAMTRRLGPALVAALLWITSPFTDGWSAIARVDMFGRGLETAAVFLVWRWPRRPWALGLSLAFAVLAMLAKQTFVAGGLTCAAYLWLSARPQKDASWWRRSRRLGALYLATWIASTLAAYGILAALSRGYFLRNVFVDTGRQLQWAYFLMWVSGFAQVHAVLVFSALLGLWRLRRWLNPFAAAPEPQSPFEQARIFALAALAGLPSVLLTANDGADVNYFFDLIWGMCGLAGISVAVLGANAQPGRNSAASPGKIQSLSPSRIWQLVCAGALLLFGLYLLVSPMRIPSAKQTQLAREMTRVLAAVPKPLLTEFVGYTLAAGSTPDYLPYMYKLLEDERRWNPQPMVDKILARKYGAVVISSAARGRWGPALLRALEQAYVPGREYPGTYAIDQDLDQLLLVPRGK